MRHRKPKNWFRWGRYLNFIAKDTWKRGFYEVFAKRSLRSPNELRNAINEVPDKYV